MGRRRVQPESNESMAGLVKNIYDRRLRFRDEPRAALEQFPDATNFVAVIRFVAAHPHPNVPCRFDDNADALRLLQRYRAAQVAKVNEAEYLIVVAARKTAMSWLEIGEPMGYLTSPRQQAEQMHRRMVAWREMRGQEVIPIYGKDINDDQEPTLVWVRERRSQWLGAATALLEVRKPLEEDEEVAAWLEYLDDAQAAILGGEPIGTGLASLLRTLLDLIDEAELEDGLRLIDTLDDDQRAGILRVRNLVREFRAYGREVREAEAAKQDRK